MARLPENAIRLYHRGTPTGHDLYPAQAERVPRTQTGTWERRVVTGPVSADAETFLSSWTQDDYSGGFGIKDANETTDTSRIAFGVMDGRRPKSMCLPPLTSSITKPAWATGSSWPLGDIGTQFYVGWANGIAGFNASTDAFYTTQNAWPGGNVTGPVGEAVAFGGYLFVPCGAENLAILNELTAGTGTLTLQEVGITAVEVGLHDGKLWAIDTTNELWQLTALGAIAGPQTLANWVQVEDAFGNDLTLDTGLTPTKLVNWFNAVQEETLWCVTRGQGAYMLNIDEPRWVKTAIKEGAHPDWGLDAEVFRDGEDLFIVGGGLDLTRETTANVEVPLSGPSKDQGVPPRYEGTIYDLCSERSSLYALVKTDATTWTLKQTDGGTGSGNGQLNTPLGMAWSTFNDRLYVVDSANNRVQYFDSTGTYQGQWAVTGLTGGIAVVQATGKVWVTRSTPGAGSISRYTSTGTLEQTISSGIGPDTPPFGIDIDQASGDLYLTYPDPDDKVVRLSSAGVFEATIVVGNDPKAIAVNQANGTFYVVCDDDDTVEHYTSAGDRIRVWGSAGTGIGQFDGVRDVVFSSFSGDVLVVDAGNNRVQRFTARGEYLDAFTQAAPVGIADLPNRLAVWVSTGANTITDWQRERASDPTTAARCWLGAWTGTAWTALWETAPGAEVVPTWMRVAMKGDYALWLGDTSGNAYRQLLPPPFFNPAARVALGVYPFAAAGWMETVRYDANMSGWDKIASHAFAQMDYASDDVYVDVSYRTDADQFRSGLADPPYRDWKRVDRGGRTVMWFDDEEEDPLSGENWREGLPFQWIQFRFDFVRGTDTLKSPIWMWHSLHHLAVPQDTASFVLKVPLKPFKWKTYDRSPDEMATTLFGLQTERAMIHLQTHSERSEVAGAQVFFRGRVTQVKAESYMGADNNLAEVVVVNFVELGASDNEHTSEAESPW